MIAQTPSWLVSMVVHLLIIITLLWVQLAPEVKDGLRNLVSLSETDSDDLDEFDDKLPEPEPFEVKPEDVASLDETVSTVEQSVAQIDDVAATAMAPDLQDFGNPVAPREGNLLRIGGDTGDGRGFNQRGGNAKARLLRKGGSKGSEAAVARGLQWLAEHQWPDGGWSFDHTQAPGCRGQCRNPGQMPEARNAATGLALLPFLGAGQTHLQGKYRKNVHAGLYFLIKRMQKNGSLSEPRGTMYSHGLASIALCEAYAMTSDRSLLPPAQGAVAFICYAQDPVGGGWRYQAPAVRGGDTSVTGWELMALTSAKMAYNVQVPPLVVNRARTFLDNVQYDGGARYGYTDSRGGSAAVTAVGLLCRMYMGWKKEEPGLKKGVEWLSAQGPSNNLYYDYYATQVMHHWEGEPWKKWNAVMRDQLVNSQAKEGHETGSWFMKEDHHGSSQGGRLYCTAMATMILEVYYRHMPIYSKRSTEEDFPID
ncbi:MAG: terpene cyclase/mutase family protein [Pirellulales bacterium]|nr:terpene cyclase/mutase family protein [Pirellulales bacterium]